MGVFSKIFTWWNGSTVGTSWTLMRRGRKVGQDEFGNTYFEARDAKDSYDGRKRRYVTYTGYAEPSKIPPEWHAWMHYITDVPPSEQPLARQPWEADHQPNFTGSGRAYRPKGAIVHDTGAQKQQDHYQAWVP